MKTLNNKEGNVIRILKNINGDYVKALIIQLLNDETKLEALDLIEKGFFKERIINTITNEDLLIDFIFHTKNQSLKYYTIGLIKNDAIKIKFINMENNIINKLLIIKSLSSDKLKLEYAAKEEFKNYKYQIIHSIKNKNHIIEYLYELSDLNTCFMLIENEEDKKIQKELREQLNNLEICDYIKNSNKIIKKELLINNIKLQNIVYDIDPKITIGIELESLSPDSRAVRLFTKMLTNWEIKNDHSLRDGVEISSPILSFNENSLKQLYVICSFLKEFNFYTNETCGGHIHLGFDYFKNSGEFKNFLELYNEIEDILYLICNKKGTLIRNNVSKYARSNKEMFARIKNLKIFYNPNFYNKTNIEVYAKLIKMQQPTRYYGLNLRNITYEDKKTIEFRFPNGEIDFNEIVYNIKLLSKLLELSVKLNNENNSYEISLYNNLKNTDNEFDKLDILLDLLFKDENEKNIYKERYQKNLEISEEKKLKK